MLEYIKSSLCYGKMIERGIGRVLKTFMTAHCKITNSRGKSNRIEHNNIYLKAIIPTIP